METFCPVTHKIQHPTRRAAEKVKRLTARKPRRGFDKGPTAALEVFKCKHCDQWHVGHHTISTSKRRHSA